MKNEIRDPGALNAKTKIFLSPLLTQSIEEWEKREIPLKAEEFEQNVKALFNKPPHEITVEEDEFGRTLKVKNMKFYYDNEIPIQYVLLNWKRESLLIQKVLDVSPNTQGARAMKQINKRVFGKPVWIKTERLHALNFGFCESRTQLIFHRERELWFDRQIAFAQKSIQDAERQKLLNRHKIAYLKKVKEQNYGDFDNLCDFNWTMGPLESVLSERFKPLKPADFSPNEATASGEEAQQEAKDLFSAGWRIRNFKEKNTSLKKKDCVHVKEPDGWLGYWDHTPDTIAALAAYLEIKGGEKVLETLETMPQGEDLKNDLEAKAQESSMN